MPQESIRQFLLLLYSVICGAAFAFLYDILRMSRRAAQISAVMVAVQDLFYWLLVTVGLLLYLYAVNDGEIRGFIIAGLLTGGVLYFLLLSKAVLFVSVPIMKGIISVLAHIIKFLLLPAVLVRKIILAIKKRKKNKKTDTVNCP